MADWTTGLALAAGVIGAGFASGREAAVFFAPHGLWGLAGVVFTACLIGRSLARPSQRLPDAFQVIWYSLLWVTLSATLAAEGEVLRHLAGWPVSSGAGLLSLLAAAAPGGDALRRWQSIAVPVLAGAILLAGAAAWWGGVEATVPEERWAVLPGIGEAGPARFSGTLPAVGPPRGGPGQEVPVPAGSAVRAGSPVSAGAAACEALLSALLYGSYTSALMGGAAESSRATGGRCSRGGWAGAALAGAGLVGSLLAVMWAALNCCAPAMAAPLPMLALAGRWSRGAADGYAWLLGVAAANAAVANAQALADRLAGVVGGPRRARLLVVLSAFAASSFGFAGLVGRVYPLLGWAWLPVALGVVGHPPGLAPRRGRPYNRVDIVL